MKKFLIFLVIFLSSLQGLLAQNVSLIDSLSSALDDAEGLEKINIYYSMAWEHRKSNPDSTLYFSDKAIDLIKELKLENNMPRAWNYKGVAYHYKGEQVKSYEFYTLAMTESLKYNDSSQYAHSLNSLGRLFLTQGDFIKSYDYYFTALEIFEKVGDQEGLSYSYKSLAELYQTQKNYQKALEMTEKALDIRLKTNNIPGQVSLFIEMAQIHEYNQSFARAFDHYLQAKIKAESINDAVNIANIDIGISHLYYLQEKYAEALIFAQKAQIIALKTTNINLLSRINVQLGKIFYVQRDFDKAQEYFKEVLKTSENSLELILQQDCYFYLSEICKNKGNINCAYENFQRYSNISSALNSAEVARAIERLESRLEIEQRVRENELLIANQTLDQAVIDRQRTVNLALGTIVVVILVMGVNLWITAKRQKEANLNLQQKNDRIARQQEEIKSQNEKINQQNIELQIHNKDLAELNNEKDTLMNIVAHDLKSPFNRIKGISELITFSKLNDEQRNYVSMLQTISQDGTDLIRDLLDVNAFQHDKRKPEIANVDIQSLLIEKVKAFYADAKLKGIDIKMIGADSKIFINSDRVFLSRILDNLISNAIKFSDSEKSVILKAGRMEDYIFISIKDFGQGFTEEDKQNIYKKFTKLSAQPTAGESSNGLGLAIVKTLVDRLEGEIELHTELGAGSEFIVKFSTKNQ